MKSTLIPFQLKDGTRLMMQPDIVAGKNIVSFTMADGTQTYAHRFLKVRRSLLPPTLEHMEQAERIERAKEIFRDHVSRGICPTCGGRLKRNLSMRGWFQCEQLGAEGFRKDPTRPSCNVQGFTE